MRVSFGSGENLSAEDMDMRDENGNKIDDYLIIYTYTGEPDEGSWIHVFPEKDEIGKCGLRFVETDGGATVVLEEIAPQRRLEGVSPRGFRNGRLPEGPEGILPRWEVRTVLGQTAPARV